jgi:hypothetical protein
MKLMIIALFCFLQLTASLTFAQVNSSRQINEKNTASSLLSNSFYEYYISLGNVNLREDVLYLESLISKKEAVAYFMAERFPVRCFVMRSKTEIDQATFTQWIGQRYPVLSYGMGSTYKEKAYLIYKKNKKPNH